MFFIPIFWKNRSLQGFEPTTSILPSRCATSWAIQKYATFFCNIYSLPQGFRVSRQYLSLNIIFFDWSEMLSYFNWQVFYSKFQINSWWLFFMIGLGFIVYLGSKPEPAIELISRAAPSVEVNHLSLVLTQEEIPE